MHIAGQDNFIYTPLFCEENIWHLARSLIEQGTPAQQLSVLFISNPDQQVAVLNQKSVPPGQPVIWDYHVVLMQQGEQDWIYDFDSRLGFPCGLTDYLQYSFPDQKKIKKTYRANFRLVDVMSYLERFSSDRSHMTGIINADKFPDYAVIESNHKQPVSLMQYIDFTRQIAEEDAIFSLEYLLPRATNN